MKKFIFYATKSVQENCLTFSCRFSAGLSSFFKTNTFTKKLVSFGALLLLLFAQTTIYGQLVGSSAVKANFGIEADVYANLLQFPNIAVPPVPLPADAQGTDDWFVNTTLYPGSGLGVIDQTLPVPGNNTAFERRQSITTPTFPYPFPVVNDYLWLDAVYGRDNYVVGGNAEKSYFAGSGDKNSDNPSTWSIGLSGSVPQKDDLIDVFAHLRGEGPRIPFSAPGTTDPRPFATLWAYAGASIAVTNGNKHVDFEFFRTEVTIANLSTPGSTGADGGRTAFTFNADGSVNVPGTIIISVDYTNGGTVPQVRIRVWMDETVFNNYDNSAPLRPFNIDKGTAFEKGDSSGTFGYAAILENVGSTNIWGRVNDTASTLGPPWGTFAGSGPDATASFQALQFVEIGINLTAFGLDKRGPQSACSNILGSLIVKTRASGGGPNEGAFGSELKDFAGPFLFGNTGTPPEPTVDNKVACETGTTGSATVDLTTGANGDNGVLTYYTNADFTEVIDTPAAYSAPAGVTTIYARSERLSNPGCFGSTSFTVTVTDNPDITVQNLTACETGETGAASVALTDAILTNPDGGVITFHNSLADAQNEANAVTSPTSVTAASSPMTFWIRAEAGTTNCYSTASFTVTVTDNPDITVQNLTACETGETGAASVDLTGAILTNPDGGVISFYDSLADAQNEANAVASPTSVTVASSPRTFWIRAEAGTTNCYSTASFTVTITDNPDITVQNLTACETGTTGAASVDLTGAILTNPDGGVITFYNSLADAQNEVNGVTSPTSVTVASSPRTFWIRAEAGTTNCYSTASFTVTVTDNPDITVQNIAACEIGTTGAASMDLTTAILTNPDGGVITFYNSLADAENEANAVSSPTSVTVASSPRTFWIRAEAGSTNCYSTASFTATITDEPDISVQNLTACETGDTGATSVALTGAILTNPDGGVITFYNSLADAQNEVNGVTSPTSVTVASSPRTFWVRAEAGTCYSTASFTVTVTDNPDITVQNIAACEIGTTGAASMDLTTAILTNPDGGVITFYNSLEDAQNEVNGVTSPTSVTVASSPRTFWIRAEAGTTNCYSTASFTVTVTGNPDVTTMNLDSCETGSTGAATFDLDNGVTGADGGTISFYISQADANTGSNPIAGKDAYSASNGLTTIYVRSANGSCFGTSSFTITVNPNPELMITNPATVCEGQTVDLTAAAVTAGSTLEGGVLSYWTDAAATIALGTPSAVMAGTYYIKVLTTAGCMDIEPVIVTAEPCGGALCTYTQGAYGNIGGKGCAEGVQYTTIGLIEKALASYGGTMVVGSGSNTVSVNSATCVMNVLPGGGGSYVLSGAYNICSLPASYLKKGRINNTLLAQTITLGLNLGIDSDLGDFVLQAGTLAVASPLGGCGSDTPMPRSCSAEGYVPVINEYKYYTIPTFVDGLTVQGLYDMANMALGGGALPSGVTLSAIASAVDLINNAFDECKIPMGYDQTPLVCNSSDPQGFVAFEVPIVNNQLTIKYKFSYLSDVTIDVYDAATGNKVFSKADTNSYLDKEVKLDYNFNTGTQKVYIVRLTTKLGHSEQKVMSAN